MPHDKSQTILSPAIVLGSQDRIFLGNDEFVPIDQRDGGLVLLAVDTPHFVIFLSHSAIHRDLREGKLRVEHRKYLPIVEN